MFKICLFLLFLTTCHAKTRIIVDGPFDLCGTTDPKDFYMEIKVELVTIGDDIFLNGTWSFFTDIKVWPVRVTLERKVMNRWYHLAVQNYNNFCDSLKSPLDVVFQIFEPQPGCPIKKGVRFG